MIGTITPTAILGSGASVVDAFGGLILLVGGLAFGYGVVRFVIKQVKRAKG